MSASRPRPTTTLADAALTPDSGAANADREAAPGGTTSPQRRGRSSAPRGRSGGPQGSGGGGGDDGSSAAIAGPANDDVDALMGEVHTMLLARLEGIEAELMRLSAERDAILVRLECVEEALGQRRSRRSELLGARLRSPADLGRLSEREQEVFHLIGRGGSTRDIAERLGVQQTTVETYIRRIRAKLEVESFHELRYIATVWHTIQARPAT